MVEYSLKLDTIFGSLADATRRDILRRVAKSRLTISEIAKPYRMSFAAIAKHLKILESAKLIEKHKRGREQIVQLSPSSLKEADKYLKQYEGMWEERLDSLDNYLKIISARGGSASGGNTNKTKTRRR